MAEPEPELFFNGIKVTEEEFRTLFMSMANDITAEEQRVANSYGISVDTASAIVYLRARSRWTPEKEAELVERDKTGNPIPIETVLSGEF